MSPLSRLLHRSYSSTATLSSNPNNINSLVTDLYKERDLRKLVHKFKQYSAHDRFRTKTGIYESTVHRLASTKRYKWIQELIDHQKSYPSSITREGFTVRLISLYGKSGLFDNARELFDQMPELKCPQTVLSLNALLGACVNAKKYDLIDGFFNELPKKLGVEPDVVSYNVLINGYCEMGEFDKALETIDEMGRKGVNPDLISFNTVLNKFYKKGKFAEGEKMWSLMEKFNVVPDVRSYNARLVGLGSQKQMSEAVALVEEMRTKGVSPDVFTINSLVDGFCKAGNLEGAKKWYSELKLSEFDPNKATFSVLIPFVCEKGDLDTAVKFCEEVFELRCLVDGSVLQAVVDELVKASRTEDAKKIVQLGKSNSYCQFRLKMPSDV